MTLLAKYNKEIKKSLAKDLGLDNEMMVPRIKKVVINAGVGRSTKDEKELEEVIRGITEIVGQAPIKTKAKKSVSGFKIREGEEIGAMVTLRGERMYSFLERLINFALPRVRDFRGLSPNAFDGQGNYSIGVKDHTVFPEISYEKYSHPFSFQINIITTAEENDQARKLLTYFGFPFKKS